jgi:type III pantothenate kinase
MNEPIARRIVAVNIGNTNVAFALFEGRDMRWARSVPVERADRVGEAIARQKDITDVVVASVNPAATRRLTMAYRRIAHRGIMTIGKEIPIPVANLTDAPERVGADRLLNALAAYRRCQGAAVVVDVGTAITFNIISKRGEFMGGLIAPGMRIAALALGEHTALLPRIQMRAPSGFFGKNTEEAMRAGVYWGTVSMVAGVSAMLQKRLGEGTALFVTGGGAHFIASHLPPELIYLPDLTLEGILCAYEACVRL